jgi:hypothetical protein
LQKSCGWKAVLNRSGKIYYPPWSYHLSHDKRLAWKQRARRIRDDDFSSTTYRDWTLRKERSLLFAFSLSTSLCLGALGMLTAAWHDTSYVRNAHREIIDRHSTPRESPLRDVFSGLSLFSLLRCSPRLCGQPFGTSYPITLSDAVTAISTID